MINLTLHGVGTPCRPLEPGEDTLRLSIDTLHVLLDELLKFKDFTITVDDANRSDVDIVLPALQAHKLKAIFFIPAGKLEQQGFLTRKDIKILTDGGMEIGTHGMYHRDWRKLDDKELSVEINESKKILEKISGLHVRKASCPYGSYDRRVLHYLRNANFHKVYTSDRGQAGSNRWIQPRNSLHCTDNPETLRFIMSQPNSLLEWLTRSTKRFIKCWR
jgi:peptidoglycan/xylan/chitin deacetylase (PgdA/CDA1 family)